MCDVGPMAQTVRVIVSTADRDRLQAIVGERNQPRKHMDRARIILACAEREPTHRVAARVGVSRPTVWRWQQRYAEAGVEGLLRDKTRKPGKTPIAAQTTARVVALTCTTPPHQATHWTGRAMAKAVGISLRSVQRIWQAHQQLCCQAGRCCRALCRSTGPRRGALPGESRGRSKRSIAPNRDCRSSRGVVRP
jgi:hypothetical protein